MIVTIFLLAFVLMVAGIAGLISAINLVPTDLGFTYFQAGSTALSAGIVVLAIGLAVRVLNRSLQRLTVPPVASAPAPEPVVDLPSFPIHAEESKAAAGFPVGGTTALGTTALGAAGAAAAVAVSSLADAGHEAVAEPAPVAPVDVAPSTLHDRLTAELERDLFAETIGDLRTALALPPVPEIAPVSTADLAMKETESAASPVHGAAAAKPDPFVFPALEPIPLADPVIEAKFDDEEPDNQQDAEPDDVVGDEDAPASSAPPGVLDADIAAATVEPDAPEPDVVPPAPASPAPGLIHDADYAAVADEVLPSLAPLAGLEIVGAYDSGGTRFTMYSDGSVTAAGPEGEKRFRSLEELRRHIDSRHA
ncbi:MAG: hypothetical protein FD175_2508 [Beijerinckiaceae bacterium]|nr:MAG: hypothetical protein FD175_2508 [Beijerinckiaceae bacterium]